MNPHSKEITGFVFYIMSEIYWYGRNWELIVVYEKQVVNNYIYVYEADVSYFLLKEEPEGGIGTKGMEKNLQKGVKAVPRIRSEISYFGKTFDFFE